MGFNLKRFTKRIIATALAGAMTVSLLPLGGSKTASAASDAVINVNTTYQEIMGYGGMNHPTWAGDLTSSQRETRSTSSTFRRQQRNSTRLIALSATLPLKTETFFSSEQRSRQPM